MKIINSFQPPHITSLILAIVVTSHQALAATTPAVTPRTCDQYFFLGKTPGVSLCRSDHVSYKCQLDSCKVGNKPWTAAIFKNCELLDKQRGKVIPGHKLPMVIPLQYHVEDAGLEVLNKDDVSWYRCPKTDQSNALRAICSSCTVQA
ncbi:hypothetical protein Pst134EA_029395 [Puccinia striiformis f. sp. tritici]|uniref:Secreted protein n=3 Tax=Puccinia striiformis TaxID=27350 RepID=A0A0L0VNW1_9BASI|nr:hypothetical protein Pst134EA_029395 [Puccinia striiformis f. sp. tritici]KAI9614349.1 hypothetical protein H4Q26_009497 [Puccinia striiformis f. sp. tritici PST-130]KNF00951.1 hypothetical protein PSTG_05846 [Puccinia striiformis f. sp. tritici PST-78]POW02169.1 hypothetical protein PSHT_12195 [Puccinia striiformis]KAH9441375.1 hypothetical protein Pst134EB_030043 [Puccinia striiformis f. sp. tritici]KAH9447356.1 hypothetical protein Pst134EA_029395 [Puccinia striiformis f. sp. tritici]